MTDPKAAKPTFARVELHQGPALVGARWWQEQMDKGPNPVSRRLALLGLAGLGTAFAVGTCGAIVAGSSSDEIEKNSIDLQRTYGWDVDDKGRVLAFDDAAKSPFGEPDFERLVSDFTPVGPPLLPFFVPTLFQALQAVPTTPDPTHAVPSLKDIIKPIHTAAMDRAFAAGRELAPIVKADTALIVDLPGPESVAFAAGLASHVDPVFCFDNWPHPRGVVPSHRTLAAAAYYQPLLGTLRSRRTTGAAPAFILDRNRLLPYEDSADLFDNRYLARLPSAAQWAELGIKRLLYVEPTADATESDDINEDLVAAKGAGIDVQTVGLADFTPDTSGRSGATASYDAATYGPGYVPHYWGGSRATHAYFPTHYWGLVVAGALAPALLIARPRYTPMPRSTMFAGIGTKKERPSGFGSMGVPSTTGSSSYSRPSTTRSGSWTRSGGGFFSS